MEKMKKMMNSVSIVLLILLMAGCCGTAQTEVSLAYEKYTLENGLEVILHKDVSDPVVAVAIQYHVGSNREKPGKTGFAHFFEHMLFQRSENLPRNAFFQKIDQLGGEFNGGTWNDGTVYYESVPRDALEKILWMESDRMGFFINTVTEGGLKREIDVVSNEKRQYENAPYGMSDELMTKNFYPAGHPYSWTVIGEIPDLRSATIEDVKEFYGNYYIPNNATLVIAGDFDDAQVKELVEKYFGEIKAGTKPTPLAVQPVVLDSLKKISHEDPYANAPLLEIAYPGVEMYNKDGYALDFLCSLLADDKKSPMYKVLVEEKKLTPAVDMYHQQLELGGRVQIAVTTFPDVSLEAVQAGINESYARFEATGVDGKDLERYKNQLESRVYKGLISVADKSLSMAQDNVFGGAPDRTLQELLRYRAVTPADVMRVYEQYVKGKNYVAISTVPKGQSQLALTGSVPAVIAQESIADQKSQSEVGALVDDPYERTVSKIDRSIEPALLSNTPQLNIPAVWATTLANGMEAKGIEYTELPFIHFVIDLNEGALMENQLSKAGIAQLTAAMLNEGTVNKTPEELEEAIGQLGATITVRSGAESMYLSGDCLKKDLPQVISLVQEMLLEPRWDEKAFAVVKERQLDKIRQDATQPSTIGLMVFRKLLYGNDNMLSVNAGTEESLTALTLDDVKAFYATHFSPSIAKLSFVGGLSQKETERVFASLTKAWSAKEVAKPIIIKSLVEAEANIYFVDYPGSTQSFILFGSKTMPYNDPAAYAATIVNDHLGASSGGMLFDILRLKHGYTYGAYSSFAQGKELNMFMAYSNVEAKYTQASLALFRDILTNYGEQYSETDLENTSNTMLRNMNGTFERPSDLMAMLRDISVYNMPADYVKQRESMLKSITLEQAKAHIAKNIDLSKMIIVVVGDAKTQFAATAALGLGKPILVDKNAQPVK